MEQVAETSCRQGEPFSAEEKEHRRFLCEAESREQDEFDRTVISLSAGSIGVSFAFLKDVVGSLETTISKPLLVASWLAWGAAIAAILVSMYLGPKALAYAREQLDQNRTSERSGGPFAVANMILNALGGLAFLTGLALMVLFVLRNVWR